MSRLGGGNLNATEHLLRFLMETNENSGSSLKWGAAAALLVVLVAGGLVYLSRERARVQELASSNQALNASMTQMKSQFQAQIDGMTEQLRERAASARAEPLSRSAGPEG